MAHAPGNHNALSNLIPSDEDSIDDNAVIYNNTKNVGDDPRENDEGQDTTVSQRGAATSSALPPSITTTTTGRARRGHDRDNDPNEEDRPLTGRSDRNPRQPRVDPDARLAENRGLLIAPHHIVLRVTEEPDDNDNNYEETKGTITLHEVLGEYHRESRDIRAAAILESVLETVWTEHTSIGRDRDILLIEVTPDVIRRKLVDDAATHCFPKQAPRYTIASKPADALAYYYGLWVARIPRLAAERRAWVADIEDRFCTWQIESPVAAYHDYETIENLRLAIQFVKKWMDEPEPGVTEQMIPGHLKLIQKGWNELRDATMPSEQELRDAAAAREAVQTTDSPVLRYPREYFQTLPTTKTDRVEYVKRIRHNYDQWRHGIVAQQFRKNVLLAFEKLMDHTTEWLGYTNTDKSMTESTLHMFFGLLKDRWNEFLDKTDKYTPLLVKRPRSDDDDSDGGAPSKKVKTASTSDDQNKVGRDFESIDSALAVESNILTEAAKPAAATRRKDSSTEFPIEELKWEVSDDGDFSQVSLPFAKLIDANPLRSDATKELFGAVDQNDLAQVQHWYAQGATSNLCDEFGETPLHRAAAVGNKVILDHLRLWGADPNIKNSAGELPIHVAAWCGHANVVKFFLRQLKTTSLSTLVDYRGRTPLHLACQQGHIAVVRELIDNFRHEHVIEMLDHDRLSPRHYALMGGHAETVQHLDGLGANTSDANTFDPTSVFDACSTGRLGLVQWIVESTYVDLTTARDQQGRTARECAQQGGHSEVVEWIDALD